MNQQRLFTVVETGENNIARRGLFVIVAEQVVTVLMIEQCCDNIVDNIACSPVDNLQQAVRFYACIELLYLCRIKTSRITNLIKLT